MYQGTVKDHWKLSMGVKHTGLVRTENKYKYKFLGSDYLSTVFSDCKPMSRRKRRPEDALLLY